MSLMVVTKYILHMLGTGCPVTCPFLVHPPDALTNTLLHWCNPGDAASLLRAHLSHPPQQINIIIAVLLLIFPSGGDISSPYTMCKKILSILPRSSHMLSEHSDTELHTLHATTLLCRPQFLLLLPAICAK